MRIYFFYTWLIAANIFCLHVFAQTSTFTGTGNWNTGGNWSAGVPTAGVNAIIDGTCTLNVNATCNNLTINAARSLNCAGFNLNVNGTSAIDGTLSDNNNAGTNTFTGLVTIGATGSLSTTNNSVFNFAGGITNNGTLSIAGSGNINFTAAQTATANAAISFGGTRALQIQANTIFAGSSTITCNGAVTISNGITLTNNNTNTASGLTIVGQLNGAGGAGSTSTFVNAGLLNYQNATQPMATGILDASTNPNTVNYSAAANQTLNSSVTYNNLTISGTLNTQIKTWVTNGLFITITRNITGNLRITGGTFRMANSNASATINLTGDFIQTGGVLDFASDSDSRGIINLNGNFSQTGGNISVSAAANPALNSTIFLNNTTVAQTMTGGGTVTGGKIQVNNTNGISLTNNVGVFLLGLQNGVVTTGSNTLTVGSTADTAIVAVAPFSLTNCVDGRLARTFPNGTSAATFAYPLKKGSTYGNNVDILAPTATTGTTLTLEIFNANTGGTAGAGLLSLLNNNIYWQSTLTGTLSATVRLGVSGLDATHRVGLATTLTGAYTNNGGTVAGNTITSTPVSFGANNFLAIGVRGQLSGTYSVGTGCNYAKLTDVAFALATQQVVGDVFFEFCSTYDGTTGETFPINFTEFTTDGPLHRVTIRPATGVTGRTTSGTPASPLIVLNGIKRLTLDGRPGGVGTAIEWTIQNASTTQCALTFRNEATSDTLQFCNIRGSSQTNTAGQRGVVAFLGSTTTNGNSNNVIRNCSISRTGTSSPFIGIASDGDAGKNNTNNQLLSNNVFNFTMNNGITRLGYGIAIFSNNSGWTIQGNSLYITFGQSSASGNSTINGFIWIDNTGTNYLIQDNYLGGTAPLATGTALQFTNSGTNDFYRMLGFIYVNNASGTIKGNVIQNILMQGNVSGAPACLGSEFAFRGIQVQGASANILVDSNFVRNIEVRNVTTNLRMGYQGIGINYSAPNGSVQRNTVKNLWANNASHLNKSVELIGLAIGSSGAITVSQNIVDSLSNLNNAAVANACVTRGSSVTGILNTSSGNVSFTSNQIRNMTLDCQNFTGISNQGNGTFTNNIIQGIANNNTLNRSTNYGISHTSNSSVTYRGNQIYNLSSLSRRVGNNDTLAVAGFELNNATTSIQVDSNFVYSLRSLAPRATDSTNVAGILIIGNTKGRVQRNRIYDITNTSGGRSPAACGILLRNPGKTTTDSMRVVNNMITLGLNPDGSANTNDMFFVGVWNNFSTTNKSFVYFNSVLIAGNAATGTYSSFGFLRGDCDSSAITLVTTPIEILNNLMQNNRTGAGRHYAIGNQETATGWLTTTSCSPTSAADYNAYFVSNTNRVGNWLGTDRTFAQWQTSSAADGNAVNLASLTDFASPTAIAQADLHLATTEIRLNSKGLTIPSITTDFDGDVRRGPDIGADETESIFTGDILAAGGDWHDPNAWSPVGVPSYADVVVIPSGKTIAISSTTQVAQAYRLTVAAGGTLSLAGNGRILEQCWVNNGSSNLGELIVNGTLDASNGGTIRIAGHLTENTGGLLNAALGNLLEINMDTITTTNTCVRDLVASFNSPVLTNQIGGSKPTTTLHKLRVLNGGNTSLATAKNLTVQDTLFLPSASATLAIQANTLTLQGWYNGSGSLRGLPTSVLAIGGTSGGSLGTFRFAAGFQEVSQLVMNRSGANAGATLGSNLTIQTTLSLQSGILTTGTQGTGVNIPTLAPTATISTVGTCGINPGYTACQTYVNGAILKQMVGTVGESFLFPTGKGTVYRPIAVTISSNPGATTFEAEYFPSNYAPTQVTNVEAPLNHVSAIEHWMFNRVLGSANAHLTLYWGSNSDVSPVSSERQQLRVARWSGSIWENKGGAVTDINGMNEGAVLSTTELTAFSPVTLGALNFNNPLPLQVLRFSAQAAGSRAQVSWVVQNESPGDEYALERAANALDFQTIFAQKAILGQTLRTYTYWDEQPLVGQNYYRLKYLNSRLGFVQYSPVVSVDFALSSSMPWAVYPVPAEEELFVRITERDPFVLQVVTVDGKWMYEQSFQSASSDDPLRIDVKAWPAGVYVVRLQTATQLITKTIVKR